MKKIIFGLNIIVLIAGPPLQSSAQSFAQYNYADDPYFNNDYTYELGASLGIMNCFTDLGGRKGSGKSSIKDFNFGNSQFAGSIYFSGAYRYFIAVRIEGTFGRVKASDNVLKTISSSSPYRYHRNLSFRSTINEMILVTEIHPLYFKKFEKGQKLPRCSPYLVAGIGYFSFKPKARINKTWVELKPLSTEGEGFAEYPGRKPYKLKQINFPLGFGFKYKVSPNINVGVECVSRILNTDYLDDVSTNYIDKEIFPKYFSGGKLANALQLNDRKHEIDPSLTAAINEIRGNPNKNDSYFSISFKLGYLF